MNIPDHYLDTYKKENSKLISSAFNLTAIFTIIGYITDTPREFTSGYHHIAYLNIVFASIILFTLIANFFNRIAVNKATIIILYSQISMAYVCILTHLINNTLTESFYSLEVILHIIYIAIIGFLVNPLHTFIYGGLAVILNLITLYFSQKSSLFVFQPSYTTILVGFPVAMYYFSKKSILAYSTNSINVKTIKQQNKEIQDLNTFKHNLTASLVHDLKNPLNIILNIPSNEMITISAKRMNLMLQNMLDVEKYENTNIKLNNDVFNLKEITEHTVSYLNYALNEKALTIEYLVPKPFMLKADLHYIERVIENLLSNAIRFSPMRGKITISAQNEQNGKSRIAITNNGPHIPEDNINTIFEKFAQVDKSVENTKLNSGLGLTFCKMAIEAHGETMLARNTEDGVSFEFTLPTHQEQRTKLKKNHCEAHEQTS